MKRYNFNIRLLPFMVIASLCVVLFLGCSQNVHEHEYSIKWTSNSTYHWHAATCEHTTEVSDKAVHTWDDGVVTKEATEDENGIKTFTCSVCNKTKTKSIPATSVNTYLIEDFENELDSDIWKASGAISNVLNQDPVFASWAQYGDALVDTHGKVYQIATYDSNTRKGGTSNLTLNVNPTEEAVLSFEYKADLWTSNEFTVKVDNVEKLNTTDMQSKWIKKSIAIPEGNHEVVFSVRSKDGSIVTSGITNSVYIDNVTLVSDVLKKVVIYPKGLQETFVGGNTIQFSAKALRSDGSEMNNKSVIWSATGGTISSTGLFTPGNTAGTFTVTASINGKTASNSTVKVHNANYKAESYKIGNITYTGCKSSNGVAIANTNNVTFDTSEGGTPKYKTVTADGFIVLKGTVAAGKYAVVRTSKTVSGKEYYTMNVLKGNFCERIWLRFGPGVYSVMIYDSDITFRDTGDSRYEGDIYGSWGGYYIEEAYNTNRILSVTNTAQTECQTAMWTMPSYYCQSDDFIVSNAVNALLAEAGENATDGEKMRVMHDWLVQRSHYDYVSCNHTAKRKKQDAISVINYEMAVCEGYANALIAMYRNAGFVSKFIVSESMNHGWLQTLYKNNWKLVDPTWDEGYSDQGGSTAAQDANTDKCPNSENYQYFLVGLGGVNNDHYSYNDDFESNKYTARCIIAEETQYRLPGAY